MNLHIVPDNVFINKFYSNLQELNIVDNNKIVVRTNNNKLKNIKHDLPFGKLYTNEFDALAGDTKYYSKVFIHQFTPLLYRWAAANSFQELNWMVWGSDLYNLAFVNTPLYEKLTKRYLHRRWSMKSFLYRMKVSFLHDRYRKEAYSKVANVLTWMASEYDFARRHIPDLRAGHEFFFYENDMPYQLLDEIMLRQSFEAKEQPVYILGNSATLELNHLDAVAFMEKEKVCADLWIPVSYGDWHYARFLKKNLSFYTGGTLRFIDEYLDFGQYLQLLNEADGLIMNNIRPQGYGNILTMMYLGKKIFLNDKNLSTPELDNAGLLWQPINQLRTTRKMNWIQNKKVVTRLLSHDTLLKTYKALFL
jgi:dTDP-N-acetylfucosamine:lipid II N-acetylfucosaminyltransferase